MLHKLHPEEQLARGEMGMGLAGGGEGGGQSRGNSGRYSWVDLGRGYTNRNQFIKGLTK